MRRFGSLSPEEAAHGFEVAAKMHHAAAKHCASGNYEKAESHAMSAAQTEGIANRHAMQAVDQFRHHAEAVTVRKAEAVSEEAARSAQHELRTAMDK